MINGFPKYHDLSRLQTNTLHQIAEPRVRLNFPFQIRLVQTKPELICMQRHTQLIAPFVLLRN